MQHFLFISSLYAVTAPLIWAIVFFNKIGMRKNQAVNYAFYFFISIWMVFMGVFADYNQFWELSLIMNFFYPLGMIVSPILFVFFLYQISTDSRKPPKWTFFLFLIPLAQFLMSTYAFYIIPPLDTLKIYFYDIVFGRKDFIPEGLLFTYYVNFTTSLLFALELISTIIISFYLVPQITRKSIQDSSFIGNKRLVSFLYVLTVLAILGIGTIIQQAVINNKVSLGFQIGSELFWGTGWIVTGHFMLRIINIERLPALNYGQRPEVSLQHMIYLHFETEKPYLNSTLTIDQLAKELKSNRTYISKTLKDGMGTNFNDFINGFRISFAKNMLLEQRDAKLYDVAMQSGFNSYSTFFRAFKEQTGFSPKEFTDEFNVETYNLQNNIPQITEHFF